MASTRKLLALLIIPALLLLSGCEMTVKTEIQSEKSQKTSIEMSFTKDSLKEIKSFLPSEYNLESCEGIRDFMLKESGSQSENFKNIKVTDKSSSDSVKCLFENKDDKKDKPAFDVKAENDKFVITPSSDFARTFNVQELKQVSTLTGTKADFFMEITTPGKIKEVRGVKAKLSGNTVKFSLLDVKNTKDIKITCERGSTGSVIFYVVIFIVIVAGVALLLFVILSKRNKNKQSSLNTFPQHNGNLPQSPSYPSQGVPYPPQNSGAGASFMPPPVPNTPGYLPAPGQPPVGQPPVGQPPVGQPPVGQPPVGQPPVGTDPEQPQA